MQAKRKTVRKPVIRDSAQTYMNFRDQLSPIRRRTIDEITNVPSFNSLAFALKEPTHVTLNNKS